VLFYVDSGAGQCLCSCSSAFLQISPCQIEITGVAGSLQIYGIGTAIFIGIDTSGHQFVFHVNNCLFSRGQFNLLSVSQVCQSTGNGVDLSHSSPALMFQVSGVKQRKVCLPLFLEDGLFAILLEPLHFDDPRYASLPKVEVTPGGDVSGQ
jgi:hypothetical protein